MNRKKKTSWLSLILAFLMVITTSVSGLLPTDGLPGVVQAAGTRTIYFTTMNNDEEPVEDTNTGNDWHASDIMYIWVNNSWSKMTLVKKDTLNKNNADDNYDGYIWSAEIPDSVGTEFRFGAQYGENGDLTWQTASGWENNDHMTAPIKITNAGYSVMHPTNASEEWIQLSTQDQNGVHVFYNYATYKTGTDDSSAHNHGVSIFSIGSESFKSYTIADVTSSAAGKIFYIHPFGNNLGTLQVTYQTADGVSKTGDLTLDETTGMYSFTAPAMENTEDGEYVYATVKTESGDEILPRTDLRNVEDGKNVYYYGKTITSTESVASEWDELYSNTDPIAAGTKLYIGSSEITSITINGVTYDTTSGLKKEESDNIYYLELPEGVIQNTVITAGAAVGDVVTTYHFQWRDTSKNELTINGTIAGVNESFTPTKWENGSDGNIFGQINGKSLKLSSDVEYNSTIKITEPTVLDLNGHRVTTNTRLFNITGKGSLTIIDSVDVSGTKEVDQNAPLVGDDKLFSGTNYQNWVKSGSVTQNNDNSYTITYYVTEATETSSATEKGTEDIRYKHVDTVKGAIVSTGNTDNVIYVDSDAQLTMKSGALIGTSFKGKHAVVSKGTVQLDEGYIAGFSSNGDSGAALYMSNGTLNMTGGVIANNKAENGDGGAIYLTGSTMNMSGGYITGNTCKKDGVGGGVFATGPSKVSISGGYITNNYAPGNEVDTNNSITTHGGGGLAIFGGTFDMTGGYVTGNLATASGGGLYIGYYGNGTKYTISGGKISSNLCYSGEGGGFRVSNGSTGSLSGNTYVTNNKNLTGNNATHNKVSTKLAGTWGGGGIFVQEGGSLSISSALITNNDAGGYGGGFAACPTGAVLSVSNTGAAIYGNTALDNNMTATQSGKNKDEALHSGNYSNNVKDYFKSGSGNAKDYFSAGQAAVNGSMLGYTTANWSGYVDSNRKENVGMYDTVIGTDFIGLNASPTQADQEEACGLATVVISGNYSYTHGGGVMTNGNVTLGTTDSFDAVYPNVAVEGNKAIETSDANQTDYTGEFSFSAVKSLIGTAPAVNADGKISFPTTEFTEVGTATIGEKASDGTYPFRLSWNVGKDDITNNTVTYYLYENPGDVEFARYSDDVYKVTLTIASKPEKLFQKLNMTYNYISKVEISKGTVSGREITWTSVTSFTATQNADYSETITFSGATFTNTVELPDRDISIEKQWLTNTTNDDGEYLKNENATESADFYLYRYSAADKSDLQYYGSENGSVSWIDASGTAEVPTGATKVSASYDETSQKIICSVTDLDVYKSYNKNTEGGTVAWTYGIAEAGADSFVSEDQGDDSPLKLSSGNVYHVVFRKAEVKDTDINEVTNTSYIVTNRPKTYELPLTGSNGWNKQPLYLLMLLIATSAVGIYNINKLKREKQVQKTNQEEN